MTPEQQVILDALFYLPIAFYTFGTLIAWMSLLHNQIPKLNSTGLRLWFETFHLAVGGFYTCIFLWWLYLIILLLEEKQLENDTTSEKSHANSP